MTKKLLLIVFVTLISFSSWAQPIRYTNNIVPLYYNNPTTYKIAEIKVYGLQTLSYDNIVSISGLKVGDKIEIPSDDITQAIKYIWRNKLVDDVSINVSKVVGENIYLAIVIEEISRLSKVVINGYKGGKNYREITKGERTDIKELLPIQSGEKLTLASVKKTKNAIEKFYREKGYFNLTIETRLEDDKRYPKENHKKLFIDISKGEKVKINQILFKGNYEVADISLKKKLKKTKEKKFTRIFSRSKYIRSEFVADKDALINYYNSLGYRDARILGEPKITNNDDKTINIEIDLYEGSRYYFGNIKWVGNYIHSDKELNSILQLDSGQIYNKELLDTRINYNPTGPDVSSLYLDDGYLFFSARPVEVRVNKNVIDIEIRVYEGQEAILDGVIIKGNTKTSDHVIRREIRTLPGDKFSRSALIRTQRELAQLGYFEPEQIGINPIPNQQKGTVDIEYTVVEKPSDQLQLSGGWGGIVGFVGTLGLSFNNFSLRNVGDFKKWSPLPSGDGQRVSVRFQANGRSFQTYSLSFTEPWLFGKKPNSLTFSVNHSISNNLTSGFERVGFLKVSGITLSLGKRLQWPDSWFTLLHSVSFLHYDLENSQFSTLCDTCTANILTYSPTIARDNRGNNPNFYTSGSMIKLGVNATLPYSLIDKSKINLPETERFLWTEYHKWNFDSEWYFQLTGNRRSSSGNAFDTKTAKRPLVLQARTHFGYLASYNSKIGVGPFERFILGGDGLSGSGFGTFILGSDIIGLRGYNNNSIIPEGGDEGGVLFNKFVFELRYPLVTEGAATIFILSFLEGGNNWASFQDYNPFELKRSGGFGARIFMPAFGMIGVDFAKGFDVIPGCAECNAWQPHFTIGQQLR